jgi:hypothetical protein
VSEWRVTVRLKSQARGARARALEQLTDGLHARLGQLATVSGGGSDVFVYTDNEAAASEAASIAHEVLGQLGVPPEVELDHWNPFTEEWDAGPAAEPTDAGRDQRIADETRRSEASGVPTWTVSAALSSRRDAIELARGLRCLGLPAVRRGKSVLLGASNEDVAAELAQRFAEQGCTAAVRVERTLVWAPPVDWGPTF